MEQKNFDNIAEQLLLELANKIESQDHEYQIDVDYSNEVLTLDIDDNIFVVNKQSPAREIWLASPVSGPYHFKEEKGQWIDKDNNNLHNILSRELSNLINKSIILK